MGEVYRASDSRLGREVAIKISQEKFSERNYLVMELVEGPTLADRIAQGGRQIAGLQQGPIPLEEALPGRSPMRWKRRMRRALCIGI